MSSIRVMVPALLVLIALVSAAEARVSRQPAPLPTPPAASPSDKTAPAPAVKVATCEPVKCCPPSICYKHHKACGCFDSCKRTELILQVKDPCTCCLVEVPVCIPACCTEAPTVCSHKGFLRHQVVEYSWPSGFFLKVVFDRRGDIVVHYFG